jgi:hypothetical protein
MKEASLAKADFLNFYLSSKSRIIQKIFKYYLKFKNKHTKIVFL